MNEKDREQVQQLIKLYIAPLEGRLQAALERIADLEHVRKEVHQATEKTT